jgi:hypothetical protein
MFGVRGLKVFGDIGQNTPLREQLEQLFRSMGSSLRVPVRHPKNKKLLTSSCGMPYRLTSKMIPVG